jgi:hypothetical protein
MKTIDEKFFESHGKTKMKQEWQKISMARTLAPQRSISDNMKYFGFQRNQMLRKARHNGQTPAAPKDRSNRISRHHRTH